MLCWCLCVFACACVPVYAGLYVEARVCVWCLCDVSLRVMCACLCPTNVRVRGSQLAQQLEESQRAASKTQKTLLRWTHTTSWLQSIDDGIPNIFSRRALIKWGCVCFHHAHVCIRNRDVVKWIIDLKNSIIMWSCMHSFHVLNFLKKYWILQHQE